MREARLGMDDRSSAGLTRGEVGLFDSGLIGNLGSRGQEEVRKTIQPEQKKEALWLADGWRRWRQNWSESAEGGQTGGVGQVKAN